MQNSKQNKSIVILDDDSYGISSYINELKSRGYVVKIYNNWPTLVAEIEITEIEIDLLILDIMLPGHDYIWFNGKYLATRHGYNAGVIIGQALRETGFDCPIIFLTSVSDKNIITHAEHFVKDHKNTAIMSKGISNDSCEFADRIDEFFKNGKLTKANSGIISLLSDSLVLRPNIFGFGIDIKKIMKIE